MMYKQPTAEEYELNLLLAKRDLATNNAMELSQGTEEGEFFTRETFFKDLRKASHRIKPKSSPKQS